MNNLNDIDKQRIKTDIKISLFLSFSFSFALVLLVAIVCGIICFFVETKSGILQRILTISFFLFTPFLYFLWLNLLKYIDLKKGEKIRLQTNNYDIKKVKKSVYFISKNPNYKIEINEDLFPLINPQLPILIEFTKISKTLLFISNSNENLLDEIEKDIEIE